jgi:hypothetical protein
MLNADNNLLRLPELRLAVLVEVPRLEEVARRREAVIFRPPLPLALTRVDDLLRPLALKLPLERRAEAPPLLEELRLPLADLLAVRALRVRLLLEAVLEPRLLEDARELDAPRLLELRTLRVLRLLTDRPPRRLEELRDADAPRLLRELAFPRLLRLPDDLAFLFEKDFSKRAIALSTAFFRALSFRVAARSADEVPFL